MRKFAQSGHPEGDRGTGEGLRSRSRVIRLQQRKKKMCGRNEDVGKTVFSSRQIELVFPNAVFSKLKFSADFFPRNSQHHFRPATGDLLKREQRLQLELI
jgi:hypothetical protein